MKPWRLIHRDCVHALDEMDEQSVDAIVTDPPYGLGFMGKQWDDLPPSYVVARAMLRVLKPGGHVVAFGGTRTYHRLACALEDAGFEIRDSLMWITGSGFPKSLDVSKAIDKASGAERVASGSMQSVQNHNLPGTGARFRNPSELDGERIEVQTATLPTTESAKQWYGWGTALKPAHEPIVLARKPLVGTVAANVQQHGTGALNVDGCRVDSGPPPRVPQPQLGVVDEPRALNIGTGEGRSGELSADVPGRWPPNLLLTHGACCGDECGPCCPVAEMDRQSGESTSSQGAPRSGRSGDGWGLTATGAEYDDSGGSSRFFPRFRYVAKASTGERNAGLEGMPLSPRRPSGASFGEQTMWNGENGDDEWRAKNPSNPQQNTHPTVKPIELMRWLVRLVTPPGGAVLDPFAGSGTTLIAALQEGFECIGIERESEYIELAQCRIFSAVQPGAAMTDAARVHRIRCDGCRFYAYGPHRWLCNHESSDLQWKHSGTKSPSKHPVEQRIGCHETKEPQ